VLYLNPKISLNQSYHKMSNKRKLKQGKLIFQSTLPREHRSQEDDIDTTDTTRSVWLNPLQQWQWVSQSQSLFPRKCTICGRSETNLKQSPISKIAGEDPGPRGWNGTCCYWTSTHWSRDICNNGIYAYTPWYNHSLSVAHPSLFRDPNLAAA